MKKGLLIGAFYYDPFQMHQVAMNLRKQKVPCVEFNQGPDRLKADTFLWGLFQHNLLDVFPDPILEAHVKGAIAKEFENEQLRIVKGTASSTKKVDGAVALSMACYKASELKWTPEQKRTSSSYSIFQGK